MNIILCGPPFSGKTTLGKLTAAELGWEFIDSDRLLEHCYNKANHASLTYKEIHRKEGEEGFREYESKALQTVKERQRCVIALGGGSLNKVENVHLLKQLGPIIYLKASLETLRSRLLTQPLPSYLEKEADPLKKFEELVMLRTIYCEDHANWVIETDSLSQSQIIALICRYQNGQ